MALVLFGTLAVLLFLSVPIAISVGMAVAVSILFSKSIPLTLLAQNCFTAVDSFPLMGVPFYMLAGALMVHGGTARRLVKLASVLVGWLAGGLAIITTVACMFFGAISGSGPGTTAAIGSLMIPSMKEAGYESGFAAAITACAGTIGVIIPPSIPFVVYGVTASVSIADMFMAGILPGIVVGLGLIGTCFIIAKKRGYGTGGKLPGLQEIGVAFKDAIWGLLVPIIILGGIYSGIFTPTEAAVVGVDYAIIVGVFVYRELNIKNFSRALLDACLMTGTILIINGISAAFGQILTMEQIPTAIANFMLSLSSNRFVILFMINVLLLFVGCFFETLSSIIILTPIFLPVAAKIGVDPIHFGIIMVTNLAIGFVTPPLGSTLFLGSQIAEVPLERTVKAEVPLILSMLATLMIITYLPVVSLWLPTLIGR